jgi:hypothetical protein
VGLVTDPLVLHRDAHAIPSLLRDGGGEETT